MFSPIINLPQRCALVLIAAFGFPSALHAIDFGIERVATGLDHPVYVTQAPGETDVLHVLEQRLDDTTTGRVSTIDLTTGTRQTLVTIDGLDARAGFDDGGLHTMAFHPDYQTNGKFYVSWVDGQGDNRVDEFTVAEATATMSAEPILRYPSLHNRPGRHSIAWVGFKPNQSGDARNQLYITTGDGGFSEGSASYVNVSQDLGTTYGKVLRVEVGSGQDDYPSDMDRNFGVPVDNPHLANASALGEVFHSGLRNPWRVSFDRATGDMYVGDVGWLTREEINFIKDGQQGLDFGWSRREGTIEVPGGSSPDIGGPLGDSINPIHEYDHGVGVSIAGGYAYRGPIQNIQGDYFFADSFSGRIWSSRFDRDTDASSFNGMNLTSVTEISADLQGAVDAGVVTNVVSFGEDNVGNLYLVKIGDGGPAGSISQTGEIFRLVAPPDPQDVDELLLLVNPTTGDIQLRNQSGGDVSFEGYTLRSASGSLDPNLWHSLDDLDGPGNDDGGWRESNASTEQLSELLQSGDFTLPADHVLRFGEAFEATGGSRDLVFQYLLEGQSEGTSVRVLYASLPEQADYDGNGVVDAADYALWREQLGTEGIGLAADGDGNGIVDSRDYEIWKSNFGAVLSSQSADGSQEVPEPAAGLLVLAMVGATIASVRRHPHNRE